MISLLRVALFFVKSTFGYSHLTEWHINKSERALDSLIS